MRAPIAVATVVAALTVAFAPAAQARTCESEVD
jgi:hypothetical protein